MVSSCHHCPTAIFIIAINIMFIIAIDWRHCHTCHCHLSLSFVIIICHYHHHYHYHYYHSLSLLSFQGSDEHTNTSTCTGSDWSDWSPTETDPNNELSVNIHIVGQSDLMQFDDQNVIRHAKFIFLKSSQHLKISPTETNPNNKLSVNIHIVGQSEII